MTTTHLRRARFSRVLGLALGCLLLPALAFAQNIPPRFVSKLPAKVLVELGGSTSLSIVATGTPAPTYQWRKNGVAIPGATNALLQVGPAASSDAGKYDLVATNSAGTRRSNATMVTVALAPAALNSAMTLTVSGEFKMGRESVPLGGDLDVVSATTAVDSDDPQTTINYTFTRLSPTKATLVLTQTAFDAELGAPLTITLNFRITFTQASNGAREATFTGIGQASASINGRTRRASISGRGTLTVVETSFSAMDFVTFGPNGERIVLIPANSFTAGGNSFTSVGPSSAAMTRLYPGDYRYTDSIPGSSRSLIYPDYPTSLYYRTLTDGVLFFPRATLIRTLSR